MVTHDSRACAISLENYQVNLNTGLNVTISVAKDLRENRAHFTRVASDEMCSNVIPVSFHLSLTQVIHHLLSFLARVALGLISARSIGPTLAKTTRLLVKI